MLDPRHTCPLPVNNASTSFIFSSVGLIYDRMTLDGIGQRGEFVLSERSCVGHTPARTVALGPQQWSHLTRMSHSPLPSSWHGLQPVLPTHLAVTACGLVCHQYRVILIPPSLDFLVRFSKLVPGHPFHYIPLPAVDFWTRTPTNPPDHVLS